MQKQSKPVCYCNTSKANLRQSAVRALKPIHSSDPVVHMRNQEILMVVIVHLLERLDKTLRGRR